MNLYSYCLRIDDGAAPNPFWSVCTLVICKPKIRLAAKEGDWIVGLGSANSEIGDIYDHVVYAMKVTEKVGMQTYENYCRVHAPRKIPNWASDDFRDRAGDCIYDFSAGPDPVVRKSVHNEKNKRRDLSGEFALISARFYYFGDKAVQLPPDLRPITHPGQGHKVKANEAYANRFVEWITGLGHRRNCVLGEPINKGLLDNNPDKIVCYREEEDDETGEIC